MIGTDRLTRCRGKDSRLRVIVLGYIVRAPLGGLAWHYLHYVLGLAELGHEVFYLEDSGDSEWCCYDPDRCASGTDPTYGLKYAASLFERVGLSSSWAYHDTHTGTWMGPAASRVDEICQTADLLINVSGANPIRAWFERIPVRVLIDTDPGFTQIGRTQDADLRALAEQHTAFFTFGVNIPDGETNLPSDGFHWQSTRQPVVLAAWPATEGPLNGKFTTVMHWDSHVMVKFDGREYGMKARSFGPYMDFPKVVHPELEMALGGRQAPREKMRACGWNLENPLTITKDPWTYRDYIQRSKAEFSVAKHGFVVSQCGWFSERSANYLASGRPVIVQDTGFSSWLETGRGVLTFDSPDAAAAGIEEIEGRYEWHCRHAREVAQEYFDARKVLSALTFQAMSSSTPGVR